ncbi:hypothetical protein FKW77_003386 [Venturia effusa]|uniref:Cyanovirin-N domain-containing protein n=1 Tax=Venturia effusa TaxID=50376 RepID=A0A517LAN9_9PEZI|nr:hypothetical protein FKW77_003386 [Venturia effusa]
MRLIASMFMTMLIGVILFSMTSALALPNIDRLTTLDNSNPSNPSYNTSTNPLQARATCPRNNHGDPECGTCITLYEGAFHTGKSIMKCTPARHCMTAPSFGWDEFRSVAFSGSTYCTFSRRLDCLSNDIGMVVENSVVMQDLQDDVHRKGLRSVNCARPN